MSNASATGRKKTELPAYTWLNNLDLVIIGVDHGHREFFMKYLRGEQVDQPPRWNDYVNSLGPEYAAHKEAIRRIESEIFPLVR